MIIKSNAKRAVSVALIIATLMMVISMPVVAALDTAADRLHALGLFQGVGTNDDGTPNFDLDREPTRQEAITMLVRLLGKENEAKSGKWVTPFTDVDEWAKPYVGYAYTNGLTQGTSFTKFSGNDIVTAAQYITFILRALGYISGIDFEWDKSWELSDKLGITGGEYKNTVKSFKRENVTYVSFNALSAKLKNSDKKLCEILLETGVITEKAAADAGLIKIAIVIPEPEPEVVIPEPIEEIKATAIIFDRTELLLEPKQIIKLNAWVFPENTTNKTILWASTNKDVVTVSDAGIVTAVKDGTAIIIAAIDGVSAMCKVVVETVVIPEPVVIKVYPNDYKDHPGIPDFLQICKDANAKIMSPIKTAMQDIINIQNAEISNKVNGVYCYSLPFGTIIEEIQIYFDELEERGFKLSEKEADINSIGTTMEASGIYRLGDIGIKYYYLIKLGVFEPEYYFVVTFLKF